MDTLRIRLLCDFSTTEHWPFTRLAQELKLNGVCIFRLNIMTGDMEFLDDQGGAVYESQSRRRTRTVAPTIDEPRLTDDFHRFLHSNTTLPDMVYVLAGVGVQFFEVDLIEGSCSFYGHTVQVTGQGRIDRFEEPDDPLPARDTPSRPAWPLSGSSGDPDIDPARDTPL